MIVRPPRVTRAHAGSAVIMLASVFRTSTSTCVESPN